LARRSRLAVDLSSFWRQLRPVTHMGIGCQGDCGGLCYPVAVGGNFNELDWLTVCKLTIYLSFAKLALLYTQKRAWG
jgi:hypothetical protein